MLNKLIFTIATALTAATAFAYSPAVDRACMPESAKASLATVTVDQSQATALSLPAEEQLCGSMLQTAKSYFSLATAEVVPQTPAEPSLLDLTARLDLNPAAPATAPSRAAGTVVTGTLISKDLSYTGNLVSAPITLTKADGADNTYTISNIYNMGASASVTATINPETGTVTIPCQTVVTVSQGDVKICPMTFTNGIGYSTGDVVGKIDANGVITLPGWGLLFTEGDYAGRGYNFFTSSQWIPTNASVSAYDIVNATYVNYDCLIEQSTDNSLTFYGLSGVTAETLNARITSGHSVQIPNSYVYTNSYYGDFFIYPFDIETGKAVAGQNLVGQYADGNITFSAWAIASRSYPTLYVGYKYSEIKVTPRIDIKWPAAPQLNADGEGTEDSPFIIRTVEQFQNLAATVADGFDFDGDHFALGADLDLSSVSALSFQPVGDTGNPFNGTFDGAGHTIKNLTVANYSFTNLALFGYLGSNGVVKNLTASNIRLASTGENVAAIVGFCEGKVENVNVTATQIIANCSLGGGIAGGLVGGSVTGCSFQGALQGVGSIAGIVAQANNATITNCHVRANITQSGYFSSSCRDAAGIVGAAMRTAIADCSASGTIQDTKGYAATGGVVGRLLSESTLTRSLSVMMIQATGNATIGSTTGTVINCYQGGLIGYAYECNDITDCYCSAYVFQNSQAAANFAGGILGYIGASYVYSSTEGSSIRGVPHFSNCYFSGQVYSLATASHVNIFGTTYIPDSWTGVRPWEIAFTNCYYDNQVALLFGDEWGRPTSFFTGTLPDGFDSSVWVAQSGHYPVLKSLASHQASELSSAPVVLAEGQTATKISKNFTLTPATNVSWGISTDNGFTQETSAIAISGSTVTIKNEYANPLVAALSADGWGMRLYRLSIVPKWFDGEGTEADPFQLKTADDFIKLNTAVETYAQQHIGDHFKVMNDIDFSGSTFGGIACGYSSRMFGGTLDGNGATLHNLAIDGLSLDDEGNAVQASSKLYVGLFSALYHTATIKNLNIAADCSFKGYAYVGSIAGASLGRIVNCRNYAPVTSANSYSGGILGFNANGEKPDGYDYDGAAVIGCYNAGEVNGSYSSHGGIVGFNNALVQLCQNDGAVSGKSNSNDTKSTQHNTIGGVVGYNSGGTIDRCVNNATVTGYYAVGGVTGSNTNGASILSSVNNGIINCLVEDVRRGGIIGSFASASELSSNYYDSSINVNGGSNNAGAAGINGLSTQSLTSGDAPEGLSSDDYSFAEGLYPVLKAYADEPATAALRSMVAYFGQGELRTNALAPVRLSAGTDWSLTNNTDFSIADNTLSVVIPANLSVPTDTLTAVKSGLTKIFPIAAIPVILEGEGSESSPYLIKTPEDWNKLSDFMLINKYEYNGKFFRVVNDLDFNGDSIRLLAVNGVKFEGVFDGNNHTIKNYVYSNTNATAVATSWKGPNLYRGVNLGLFGTVGSDGVVENLTADGKFEAYNYIGGIAGDVYGTLRNCVHNGTIANTSGSYCSGVASKVLSGAQLLNCVNNGNVTSKTTYASGIAYQVAEGAVLDGCINNGNIKSGTTGAQGIAYTVAGTIRNSANHGKLSGTGTAAGICNTLAKTGKLENCYNDADILYGTAGGSIAGIVFNTTDQTTAGVTEPTSWIKNCYNTGNLSGKTSVFGFSSTIKKGVLVEDCYNTGNVDAVDTYGAYGFTGAITSNNAENLIPTCITRCWNGGNVSSNTASSSAAGGFGKTVAAGTVITDCYNLGNVTVKNQATASSQICCAVGFICQISGGTISRCWNAGDIYGLTPCNAGIAGYISGTNCTTLEECFNLGDITGSNMYDNKGTQTAGNTNGTAGGLFGYISTGNPVIRNCYNSGTVKGNNRVGGIAGGMFRPDAQVENCYSSGKVICENNWWSGTIYTSNEGYTSGGVTTPYFVNSKNIYYDADITTGTQYRDFPGSAKTTAQMAELDLGEAFELHHTYPMLKSFCNGATDIETTASDVSTAMVVLSDGDSYSKVTDIVTLAAAPDVKWSAQGDGELEIIGSTGYPRKTGNVTLTAANSDGTMKRTFALNVNAVVTGIDNLDADGKTIISTIYVDAAGRIITVPAPGQPYVVKITYDDGSSVVRKITARD